MPNAARERGEHTVFESIVHRSIFYQWIRYYNPQSAGTVPGQLSPEPRRTGGGEGDIEKNVALGQ